MSDHHSTNRWSLALFALGVVYGDIGTSPLYALKECLGHAPPDGSNLAILGPISLIFWSLTLMAMIKYLITLTYATSQGEGGMFALLSLLRTKKECFGPKVLGAALLIALFGASLLYGDGMITPAISVLSAIEGLSLLNGGLTEWVICCATPRHCGYRGSLRTGNDRVVLVPCGLGHFPFGRGSAGVGGAVASSWCALFDSTWSARTGHHGNGPPGCHRL